MAINRFIPFVSLLAFLGSFRQLAAQPAVSQIVIVSSWGGLGTPQHAEMLIRRNHDRYVSDSKPVDTRLVLNLLSAIQSNPVLKLDLNNIGITPAWLKSNLSLAEHSTSERSSGTPRQVALFETTFTDPVQITRIAPSLFLNRHTDDNPYASITIFFEDGTRLSAGSYSQFPFMIPWKLSNGQQTWNADISRAVSALLPYKTVNKERLNGPDLLQSLAEAVMNTVKPQWELLGSEDRAGPALAPIRTVYTVKAADINPYHDPAFGRASEEKGPHETNLQATLRKSTFPTNVCEHLVLLYNHNQVQGVDDFLKTGSQYESLALSVPWLNQYIHDHPKVSFTIQHIHDRSFGDHAMQTFAKDMQARHREDLIPMVSSQQSQIALLTVGSDYGPAYWLIFPDHHTMLWRYEAKRDLLNWTEADFHPAECADYRTNGGGCSGREVSLDGKLMPEPGPYDEACVASHRDPSLPQPAADESLFSVMNHGRGGFIDQIGKIRIPLCFSDVGDFSEGLARFERDQKWGYIDTAGKVVIPPVFPWAEDFSEGLAHVQITGSQLGYDGRWGYIDTTGKIVIPATYKQVIASDDGSEAFHGGLAKVEFETASGRLLSGYVDKTGKLVIPPHFAYASEFSEGLAAATESETMDGRVGWGFIDKTGQWVISPQFDSVDTFRGHLAAVRDSHGCSYIDSSGHKVLTPPGNPGNKQCLTMWSSFREDLAAVEIENKYGFIDSSGKLIIPARYELGGSFSEGLAAVKIGKQWGYIDHSGKMVIALHKWQNAGSFHNGLAEVTTPDMDYGYIDRTGHYVWGPVSRKDD